MKTKFHRMFAMLPALVLFAGACGAESQGNAVLTTAGKAISEATLQGSYVFSGRVLLNPVSDMSDPQAPERSLVQCFSIGEIWFDGGGGMRRRIEIFCPTTPEMTDAGFGAPPPIGVPDDAQRRILGSSLSTAGRYTLQRDGWGEWSDEGSYRIGPIERIAAEGFAEFSVTDLGPSGVARELHVLLKNQSLQLPGAPMLINSDVGGSFTARRR